MTSTCGAVMLTPRRPWFGQGCKIYFPVLVFYGFGIVCKKRRPGQSGKKEKVQNKEKCREHHCDTAHSFSPILNADIFGNGRYDRSRQKAMQMLFFQHSISLALKERETGFKELLSRGTFFLVTD